MLVVNSHHLVRNTVFLVILAAVIVIPLRITGYGFLPGDDAQRHAAKIVAGKSWGEILVLRPEVSMDTHPGWHGLLNVVHRATGCGTQALVVFSMLFLFYLVCLAPPLFLRRPEAWLACFLILILSLPYYTGRLVIGRPLLISVFTMMVVFFSAERLERQKHPHFTGILVTGLIALSTWMHGAWYLFIFPVAGFLAARRWRAAGRIAFWTALAVAAGALLTGQPVTFLKQTGSWPLWAFNSQALQRMLVIEFRSSTGDFLFVIFAAGLILWRTADRENHGSPFSNPAFLTALICWSLGFMSRRFWMDWGLPAAAVWLTLTIQDMLEKNMAASSRKRIALAAALALVIVLRTGTDLYDRWTMYLDTPYLERNHPAYQTWMPAPGGIVYSDDMTIFYDTFYKNPRAPWRYMLGFEPAVMPPEDLAVFRDIQWHGGAPETFKPWIDKMTAADRLILRRQRFDPHSIPALEWHQPVPTIWIGRRLR